MHHLLLRYPVDTLAEIPFQPYNTATVRFVEGSQVVGDASGHKNIRPDCHCEEGDSPTKQSLASGEDCFGAAVPRNDSRSAVFRAESPYNPFVDIFPAGAEVALPPLIGGFVGSDALACLIYHAFDRAPGPMAAIDLGTNGEVMVTDGRRILVGSTAAGPAFEGVNISCGTRAVDGAIVGARVVPENGSLTLTTVGDQPPVGLTGSGLLDLVCELRRADVIDAKGRIVPEHPVVGQRLSYDEEGVRRFLITDQGVDRRGADADEAGARVSLYLTQHDVRELQKAKGAIRAAFDTLMAQLDLQPADLQRMILTGSFGSQLDVEAVLSLGMIPPVPFEAIETSPNGAGFGAALMLDDAEFAPRGTDRGGGRTGGFGCRPQLRPAFHPFVALTPEAGK